MFTFVVSACYRDPGEIVGIYYHSCCVISAKLKFSAPNGYKSTVTEREHLLHLLDIHSGIHLKLNGLFANASRTIQIRMPFGIFMATGQSFVHTSVLWN